MSLIDSWDLLTHESLLEAKKNYQGIVQTTITRQRWTVALTQEREAQPSTPGRRGSTISLISPQLVIMMRV